jgi:ariadne-1
VPGCDAHPVFMFPTCKRTDVPRAQLPIVKILLIHFRWNQDKLIEKYMDAPDAVLRDAGEPAPPASPTFPPAKRARLTQSTSSTDTSDATFAEHDFTCNICYDTPPPEEQFALRCSHKFCVGCWGAYVAEKIKGQGQIRVTCMHEECKAVVDEPSIERLVDAACYDRCVTSAFALSGTR